VLNNKQFRLQSWWREAGFGVAWIGALSLYWIHIKMSPQFQSLFGLVGALDYPWSLINVSMVYMLTLTAITWAGPIIYLAMMRSLSLKGLLRGFLVILFVVVLSQFPAMFLKGLPIPHVVWYMMTLWLPLFLALWVAIRMAKPKNGGSGRLMP
jgi:hypothetical protein